MDQMFLYDISVSVRQILQRKESRMGHDTKEKGRGTALGKPILWAVWDYIRRSDSIFWGLTILASVCGILLIASLQRSGSTNFCC